MVGADAGIIVDATLGVGGAVSAFAGGGTTRCCTSVPLEHARRLAEVSNTAENPINHKGHEGSRRKAMNGAFV
jgi:hypothetical protein